ncbi:MAG: ribonuclease HII [Candidatus Wildermuthbacteria bacterium]|nr:ribonuclease HII [Candidatus Wildermuthbacteria bacterium]
MQTPNFAEEKQLWKIGYQVVVGLDEAGRGPLAGPVTAAAVAVSNFGFRASDFKNLQGKIRDSKLLTPKIRLQWYSLLTVHPHIAWGVGIVSEKIIDQINIFQATKLAMEKAVRDLEKNLRTPDFLMIDGNMKISFRDIPQKPIVKGDEKVFSCAAASIIAKVTRDRLMLQYHQRYPQYGFDRHKGYGTAMHLEMLKQYGPCAIHRKTFRPIRDLQVCRI